MKHNTLHKTPLFFLFCNLLISFTLIGGAFWWYAGGIRPLLAQIVQPNHQINILKKNISQTIDSYEPLLVSIFGKDENSYYLDGEDDFAIASGTQNRTRGNGFLIGSGYLMSNAHVFKKIKAPYKARFLDGKELSIDQVWYHPSLDIALAHLDESKNKNIKDITKLRLPIFSSSTLATGDFVFSLSLALGAKEHRTSRGVLSSVRSSLTTDQNIFLSGLYKNTLSLHPGESGSPLFDLEGNIVGINTAIISSEENASYALPLTTTLLQEILQLHH